MKPDTSVPKAQESGDTPAPAALLAPLLAPEAAELPPEALAERLLALAETADDPRPLIAAARALLAGPAGEGKEAAAG